MGCEPLEGRRLLANVNGIVTTGVYDEDVVDHNAVDFVATGSSLTNLEFASRVATAFGQDQGAVIDGHGLGALYNYGVTQGKTMVLGLAGGTNWGVGTGYHISGSGGFATTSPSYNSVSLNFLQIEGAAPYEHVVTFGLTALSITGRDYGNVTLTGRLAGGGTVSASRRINNATGAGDTFFGLNAPSDDYFTGFALGYSGAVTGTPDTRLWFDDLGFITAPVNRAANLPPVAAADTYNVPQNQTIAIGGAGVLANDSDPDGDPLTAIPVSGPAHGTLALAADGSFTYTPASNYVGADSFTYRASDGALSSSAATVSLNVTGPAAPPVANDDAFTMSWNTTLDLPAAGVLTNDTDPSGLPLAAVNPTQPAHGTLSLNANGSFSYTPDAGYFGADSFTYQAHAGALDSNVATVTITIQQVFTRPTAVVDHYTTPENSPLTVAAPGLLDNDLAPNGVPLRPVVTTTTTHGTLTVNLDGSFSYVPAKDFYGTDTFRYQVTDGKGGYSASVTDTITVSHVNQPPVAVDDSYAVDENASLSTAAAQTFVTMVSQPGDFVGAGETYHFDATNSSIGAHVMTGGVYNNTVSIGVFASGVSWTFRFAAPNHARLLPGVYNNATRWPFQSTNIPGLDVSGDGRGSNNLFGSFTVTQALYDDAGNILAFAASFEQHSESPTAPALTGQVAFRTSFDKAEGVLFNDRDSDGDSLTASLVTGPSHGVLTLNPDGSFSYTPNANYFGPDQFTYQVSDGPFTSDAATVSLTVNKVDQAPVSAPDRYEALENTPLNVALPGVLANDSDPEGDSLTASLVTGPSHGVLTLNPDGSFSYTPKANYFGPDQFTYQAGDGSLDGNVATVSITVGHVNQAPVATDDRYALNENSTFSTSAPGVLANDADVDGDALTVLLVSGPAHGTLTLSPDGSLVYKADANYFGADAFTYRASDGSLESAPATVSFLINRIDQPPTARDDQYTVRENFNSSVSQPGLLANDASPNHEPLTATLVAGPSHGTLTLNPDGGFLYVPAADFLGVDTFTYTAADRQMTSSPATVTLTVVRVDQPPVATNDHYSVDENRSINLGAPGVLSNDASPNREALTAKLVSGPSHGTIALLGTGAFTYTPAANFFGTDTWTYTASDSVLTSSPATVTITVNHVNQPPVATGESYATDQDSTLNIGAPGVLANDTDVDGDPLFARPVRMPLHGSLTLNGDGSFLYVPTGNYSGADSFTYEANDGHLASAETTVSLTINPVNHAPVAVNDGFTINKNGRVIVVAPGVLANDVDRDGNALVAILVKGPGHGKLSMNANGSFIYRPRKNYTGTDSFSYAASDGALTSNPAVVTIKVLTPQKKSRRAVRAFARTPRASSATLVSNPNPASAAISSRLHSVDVPLIVPDPALLQDVATAHLISARSKSRSRRV